MIYAMFTPVFLMAPPVKILIGALTIVLVVVLREIAFDPVWSLRAHFRMVNKLDAREIRWREIRAGLVQPLTDDEKELVSLSDYAFEKKVFWLWNSYPKGYLIADSKWRAFITSPFMTVELKDENEESPSPSKELGVIYHRESES